MDSSKPNGVEVRAAIARAFAMLKGRQPADFLSSRVIRDYLREQLPAVHCIDVNAVNGKVTVLVDITGPHDRIEESETL